MALKEELTFEEGHVQEQNFDRYEILRHDETPDIAIELINSTAPPTAVGESAFPPVAAAITNAIYDATNKRIRSLPINYDTIRTRT